MDIIEYWENNCKKLEDKLKLEDISDFLQWNFIRIAMFHIPNIEELNALKRSKYWDKWNKGLVEHPFGKPEYYSPYPISSGNLVHHMYSLLQIARFAEFEVTDLKSIYEFGGGYGSFCRMLRNLDYKSHYTIYDLPVFSHLQRMYLEHVKGNTFGTDFINEVDKMEVDLFISLWAIEETPVSLRDKILKNVKAKHYLFAINADELPYFTKFTAKENNHEWMILDIAHLPNNLYILGRQK